MFHDSATRDCVCDSTTRDWLSKTLWILVKVSGCWEWASCSSGLQHSTPDHYQHHDSPLHLQPDCPPNLYSHYPSYHHLGRPSIPPTPRLSSPSVLPLSILQTPQWSSLLVPPPTIPPIPLKEPSWLGLRSRMQSRLSWCYCGSREFVLTLHKCSSYMIHCGCTGSMPGGCFVRLGRLSRLPGPPDLLTPHSQSCHRASRPAQGVRPVRLWSYHISGTDSEIMLERRLDRHAQHAWTPWRDYCQLLELRLCNRIVW